MHQDGSGRCGLTIVELLIVLMIFGLMAGVGSTVLRRQGMTVGRAEQIVSAAITFTRFEAIKRNEELTVNFDPGARVAVVTRTSDGVVLRRYDLNPQDGAVEVKSVTPSGAMTFNSRGVATLPVTRTIEIGLVGRSDHNQSLQVSGQGRVSAAP